MDPHVLNETQTGFLLNSNNAQLFKTVTAIVFLFLMIFGLMFNGAVIYTYQNSPRIQTPTNVMIIGCVLCNIIMLLLGFPFVIASAFHGEWIFGEAWCEGYGFVTTLVCVTNICILTAITLDRYFIVLEKPFGKRITAFKAGMTILSCSGYGLLWATFPLTGWGGFVIEHSKLACGPDWANQNSLLLTYNVTMFFLVLVVPIVMISYSYFHILLKIFKKNVSSNEQQAVCRLKESRVAIAVFLTICIFVLSWMPYVTMSMWSMTNDISQMSPTYALIALLMAKSASVWNPLVYVAKNIEFRSAFCDLILKPLIGRRIQRGNLQQVIPASDRIFVSTIKAGASMKTTKTHPFAESSMAAQLENQRITAVN